MRRKWEIQIELRGPFKSKKIMGDNPFNAIIFEGQLRNWQGLTHDYNDRETRYLF